MNLYFGLVLLISFASLPLFGVITLYNAIGWRWKSNPSITFWAGITLLILSFAAHTYLDISLGKDRNYATKNGAVIPQTNHQVLDDLIFAYDKTQKLIEFLSIPLSVALISAAILAKADADLEKEVARYQIRRESLTQQEDDFRSADEELRALINASVRGKELIEK